MIGQTLSVIIPVYKVESTLDRCVNSILRQGVSALQIILVDDGSPDRCPELCDMWKARDPRIMVIHQENGGLSAARNSGLDVARGEYVTFVDSDDTVDDDSFVQIMSRFDDATDIVEYPVATVIGDAVTMTSFVEGEFQSAEKYFKETQAYHHLWSCNKIYRRTLFRDIRFPLGKKFEDAFVAPQVLSLARKIKTSSVGLYRYYENPISITHTLDGAGFQMQIDAIVEIFYKHPDWVDDNFYVHAANLQLDAYRNSANPPILPCRYCNPMQVIGLTNKLKAVILNLFGITFLCRLNKIYSKR